MSESPLERMPRRHIGGILVPVVIMAIIAVFFVETLDYPESEDVGPAGVPWLWMAFSMVFCVALLVQAIRRTGKPDPEVGKVGHVLIAAVVMAAYLAAIQTIGYFVSTLVFLVVAMVALDVRNKWLIGAVSFGWLAFCYVVFFKILYIPLPIGPLMKPLLG